MKEHDRIISQQNEVGYELQSKRQLFYLNQKTDSSDLTNEGNIANDSDKRELLERQILELTEKKKDLNRELLHMKSACEFSMDKQKLKNNEKELEKLESAKDKIGDIIKDERGHSEDYLHYALSSGLINFNDVEDKIRDSDRAYLIIVSDRDACNSCGFKLEDIAAIVNEKIANYNSELECKVLFFARNKMKGMGGGDYNRRYSDDVSGDNFSESRFNLFNIEPNDDVKEDEKEGKEEGKPLSVSNIFASH